MSRNSVLILVSRTQGPPGSSWCKIRSAQYIYGIPGLSEKDRHKIKLGNLQARNTAKVIKTCLAHYTPCILENPRTSMLWQAPCISRLSQSLLAQVHCFDMCQYGTRWLKPTKIISWHCGHSLDLSRLCKGRKGICSRTHKHHIVLSGSSNQSGKLWTSIAQEYPSALASALANKLINASYAGRDNLFIP